MAASGSSPNVRIKDDTNEWLHRVHAKLMLALSLGSRGITQDVLMRALLTVGDKHPEELVEATRALRVEAQERAEARIIELRRMVGVPSPGKRKKSK